MLRVPLFLFPWGTGLLASATTAFLKGIAVLVNSRDFVENIQHVQLYFLLVTVTLTTVG